GPGADEARLLPAGYRSHVLRGRPLVTLKLAVTLDGRIAAAGGDSRWITSPAARHLAHALRAVSDAVLVGAGTVRADDPRLTCRLPGGHHPVRIVLAGRALRLVARARGGVGACAVLVGAAPARGGGALAAVGPLGLRRARDAVRVGGLAVAHVGQDLVLEGRFR